MWSIVTPVKYKPNMAVIRKTVPRVRNALKTNYWCQFCMYSLWWWLCYCVSILPVLVQYDIVANLNHCDHWHVSDCLNKIWSCEDFQWCWSAVGCSSIQESAEKIPNCTINISLEHFLSEPKEKVELLSATRTHKHTHKHTQTNIHVLLLFCGKLKSRHLSTQGGGGGGNCSDPPTVWTRGTWTWNETFRLLVFHSGQQLLVIFWWKHGSDVPALQLIGLAVLHTKMGDL